MITVYQKLYATLANVLESPTARDVADVLWLANKMISPREVEGATDPGATNTQVAAQAHQIVAPQKQPSLPPSNIVERVAEDVANKTVDLEFHDSPAQSESTATTGLNATIRMRSNALLSNSYSLGKALAPLRRYVSSFARYELEEIATAERIADSDEIDALTLRPARERWLDVAVVIDESPTMDVWQSTIDELLNLLTHHGAFRAVRTYGVDMDATGVLALLSGRNSKWRRQCNPKEIRDPSRRRLILIVSDCLGDAWDNGRAAELVKAWTGDRVLLLQVMPESFWLRTGLGAAKRAYVDFPRSYKGRHEMPIPVVACDDEPSEGASRKHEALELAARLIAERSDGAATCVTLAERPRDNPRPKEPTAEERVRRFVSMALEETFQLAAWLAVVSPLRIDVMRFVQQLMMPQTTTSQLSEVIVTGLMRKVQRPPSREVAEYEFYDGVREILLESVLVDDAMKIMAGVSDWLRPTVGNENHYNVLVRDLESDAQSAIDSDNKPFAIMYARVLGQLGGEHAIRAEKIGSRLSVRHPQIELTDITSFAANSTSIREADVDNEVQSFTMEVPVERDASVQEQHPDARVATIAQTGTNDSTPSLDTDVLDDSEKLHHIASTLEAPTAYEDAADDENSRENALVENDDALSENERAARNAFIKAYRQYIVRHFEYVHLIGFPAEVLRERDAKANIRLADLLVPLVFRDMQERDKRTGLATLLKTEKSVLVLGDPGTGKTMLLTYLALLHANDATMLSGYTPPGNRIPLFVSLREFALEEQWRTISFLDYLVKPFSRTPDGRYSDQAIFDAFLRNGEAIVLLDGLDEVGSPDARKQMVERVQEWRHKYPSCPIWVTSRVHGYTHDIALPNNEFEHVIIGAFDDAQVDDFVERWYGIQLPDDPRRQAEQKSSLRQAIFRTPQVRRLAANPLLLMLMAFVHRFLGHLPQDRGELYEQCVTMLLRSWLDMRERPQKHPFERLSLAVELPRVYLEALAFELHAQGTLVADARGISRWDDALAFLTAYHLENDRREPRISESEARDEMLKFIDYACARVGLLTDLGGGKLSFLHLSLQEYLAASFNTVMTNIRDQEHLFVVHFCDRGWSEVLLLRLYLFARKRDRAGLVMFDELVRALLDELGRKDDITGWLLLGRALRDRLDVRRSQRQVILDRLVRAWVVESRFYGDNFVVLEDIRVFATDAVQSELRDACTRIQSNGSPGEAIAALYLEEKLFGGVEGAAQRFATRADVSDVLADLVGFHDVPELATFLAEKATANDWHAALSAFDGTRAYEMTFGWALGTTPCPVTGSAPFEGALKWMREKLAEEGTSRKTFAQNTTDSDASLLFQRAGTLRLTSYAYEVMLPFAGARVPREVNLSTGNSPRSLLHRALANERSKTTKQFGALELALSTRVTNWLTTWLELFPLAGPVAVEDLAKGFVRDFPYLLGSIFKRSLERYVERHFGPDFKAKFQYSFQSHFSRDFVPLFVREAARYMIRSSERGTGHHFGAGFSRSVDLPFLREYGRWFIENYGRNFFRSMSQNFRDYFIEHFGIDSLLPGAEVEFHRAIQEDLNLPILLGTDDFWNHTLFWQFPDVTLESSPSLANLECKLTNPMAIPLLLVDFFSAASIHHLFCLARHVVQDQSDNLAEAVDTWVDRHPVAVHPVAWCWDELARQSLQPLDNLNDVRAALAFAHAEYAELMTGISLAETSLRWKTLVDAKQFQTPAGMDDGNDRRSVPQGSIIVAKPRGAFIEAKPRGAMIETSVRGTTINTATRDSATIDTVPARSTRQAKGAKPQPLFTWIHLSDIHAGNSSPQHRHNAGLIFDRLRNDVKQRVEIGISRIDAMFVTGDIAWTGQPNQYDMARSTLLNLAKAAGLTRKKIFLVPGNHDVDRDVDKKFKNIARLVRGIRDRYENIDTILSHEESRHVLVQRQAAYLDFAKEFAPACLQKPVNPNKRLFWNHTLIGQQGLRIRLAGLNTVLIAWGGDDQGQLCLGKTQLDELLSYFDMSELVMLMSHHPFTGGWLADEGEASKRTKKVAHVHLSGHAHDHRSERVWRSGGSGIIRISTGAAQGDANNPWDYAYSFGAIFPDLNTDGYFMRIYPRRWSNAKQGFRADYEVLEEGDVDKPYRDHKIPRLRRRGG